MALPSTHTVDSLEHFKAHGVYYLEDGDIGDLVEKVDAEGLSNNKESWERFKEKLLGNPVRRLTHCAMLSNTL
jgi:hypothetical protein